MNATDRIDTERDFHDRQARDRAVTFRRLPEALRFSDDDYLDHETWIRPALDGLGDVAGCDVLDFGCGHGMAAVVLARRGARVTAFDLSAGYVSEAQRRARANDVSIRFVQADGDHLPFRDSSFDRIWGSAILHHLDLDLAVREIHRVLRPGGVAVFCEPAGDNPVLNLARRCLPYPGKERTPDERPLRWRDIKRLRCLFPSVEVRGFQFLAMLRRVHPAERLTATLEYADDWLLSRFPGLGRFCRYFVLTLRR